MQNPIEEVPSESALKSMAGCPGKYEIKGIIGRGGMGIVFHGYDKELGRDVAIKLLWIDGPCEEEAQERFVRESRTLSVLDHVGIVRIFTSGLNEKGYPYHVMEFLEGESLSQELSRGPLKAERFFELFRQVSSGLEHAHQKRIVHRDLKPSNIMICKNAAASADVKIIDFGIARIELSAEQASKTITRTGAILGSPLYMSPEQCRGERGDYRSDIYMLGCIMFECIAGHPPFQGDNTFETMYKHMSEPAPSLCLKTSSAESQRLGSLIERCLQKDPDARPESVKLIKTELDLFSGSDIQSIDLFSARAPIKENRRSLSVVWLILFVLFAGICIGFAFSRAQKTQPVSASFIKTEQEKISEKIASLKSRLSEETNAPSTEKKVLSAASFNDLLSLGRWQLKSHLLQDFIDAEKTYTQALDLSANRADYDFRPLCLVLRAKAKWKQNKLTDSNKDFDQALQLIEGMKNPERLELLHDLRMQRYLLRIHERRYVEALTDFKQNAKDFQILHKGAGFDLLEAANSHLDRHGDERLQILSNTAAELQTMTPLNEKEAIQMLAFEIRILESLLDERYRRPKSIAADGIKYSNFLLSKISPGKIRNELQAKLEEISR